MSRLLSGVENGRGSIRRIGKLITRIAIAFIFIRPGPLLGRVTRLPFVWGLSHRAVRRDTCVAALWFAQTRMEPPATSKVTPLIQAECYEERNKAALASCGGDSFSPTAPRRPRFGGIVPSCLWWGYVADEASEQAVENCDVSVRDSNAQPSAEVGGSDA